VAYVQPPLASAVVCVPVGAAPAGIAVIARIAALSAAAREPGHLIIVSWFSRTPDAVAVAV
jgi:hypothetical protein